MEGFIRWCLFWRAGNKFYPRNVLWLIVLLAAFMMGMLVDAHPVPTPWVADLVYIKDERTKACFAYKDGGTEYGPYFSFVPCELLDKANWHFYE
jgi:hypothetical protein